MKVDQIIDAAISRLVEAGYQELSIADVARELGLAQNAIYWYFPSKDHLFVAALQRIVDGILKKKPRGATTGARIVWFADRLQEFQPLRAAMHERARVSPLVAEFETGVYAGMRSLLHGALSETVAPGELEITTDAVMGAVEGVLLQSSSRKRRAEVLQFVLERLAGIAD